MGFQIPQWEGAIFRGTGASHCKVCGHSAVSCAEPAEPIEILFGLWARMSPMNHALDGAQIPLARGNLLGKGRLL